MQVHSLGPGYSSQSQLHVPFLYPSPWFRWTACATKLHALAMHLAPFYHASTYFHASSVVSSMLAPISMPPCLANLQGPPPCARIAVGPSSHDSTTNSGRMHPHDPISNAGRLHADRLPTVHPDRLPTEALAKPPPDRPPANPDKESNWRGKGPTGPPPAPRARWDDGEIRRKEPDAGNALDKVIIWVRLRVRFAVAGVGFATRGFSMQVRRR